MSVVDSARGPVPTAELGTVLMHEHVLNITAEIANDQPELSWRDGPDAVVDHCVERLREAKAAGIDTILDATAMGHGRDLPTLRRIAEQVEVNILVCTGLYTYDQLPFFFAFREQGHSSRDDVMVEFFVRDIQDGIAGTGIRAAAIKCATDKAGVTPSIERVLRSAARAHRETGVPITTHTDASLRNGLDQQRIFREEGVELEHVVIGHSGDSQDLDYLRALMDAGSYIGADRFGLYLPGWPTFEQRVDTVARLCERGYAERIVLSHDATLYTDWQPPGAFDHLTQWNPTHVPTDVVPALRALGVTDEHVRAMLIDNPRRLFEGRG